MNKLSNPTLHIENGSCPILCIDEDVETRRPGKVLSYYRELDRSWQVGTVILEIVYNLLAYRLQMYRTSKI